MCLRPEVGGGKCWSSVRKEGSPQGANDQSVALGDVTGQDVYPGKPTLQRWGKGEGLRLGDKVTSGYGFLREKRGHLKHAMVVGDDHIERT